MRVFVSRMTRIRAKDATVPMRCFAQNYFQSFLELSCECDCSVFCKFPPPGNTPMPITGIQHTGENEWRELEREKPPMTRRQSA